MCSGSCIVCQGNTYAGAPLLQALKRLPTYACLLADPGEAAWLPHTSRGDEDSARRHSASKAPELQACHARALGGAGVLWPRSRVACGGLCGVAEAHAAGHARRAACGARVPRGHVERQDHRARQQHVEEQQLVAAFDHTPVLLALKAGPVYERQRVCFHDRRLPRRAARVCRRKWQRAQNVEEADKPCTLVERRHGHALFAAREINPVCKVDAAAPREGPAPS